jgi:Ion channel
MKFSFWPSIVSAIAHPERLRFTHVYFLIALTLLFVAAPFLEHSESGALVEAVLMTLVLLSAVLAIGGRRRTLVAAAVLVIPALMGKWLFQLRPDVVPPEIFLGGGLLFTGFVLWHLFRYILLAPSVNSEVICAGIATYLLLGLLWSIAYMLMARIDPDAFAYTIGPKSVQSMTGFVALYFSILSLNASGYGDIIPISGPVRMLVMAQQTTGMFYVAILISRLVSAYAAKQDQVPPIDPPQLH